MIALRLLATTASVAAVLMATGAAVAEELELACSFPQASQPADANRSFVIDTDRQTAIEMSARGLASGVLAKDGERFTLTLPRLADRPPTVVSVERAGGAATLKPDSGEPLAGQCEIRPAAKLRSN